MMQVRLLSLEEVLALVSNYYLWLLTLTLVFASSIIFFKLYQRSRQTPLGRASFFNAVSAFLWSLAIAVLSVPSIIMAGVFSTAFLVATSLAGIASILAAYYKAMVQWLITPSEDARPRDLRVFYVLCGLASLLALFSIISVSLRVPFWLQIMGTRSVLGDVGVFILAVSLIAVFRYERLRKLARIGIAVAIAVGVYIFVDNWVLGWIALSIRSSILQFFLNPFNGGFSSDLAAAGLIVAGLGAFLSIRKGLKTWTAQFIPSTCVVVVGVLALLGYGLNVPTLFDEGLWVALPALTSACFILIGLAQVWYAWNRR